MTRQQRDDENAKHLLRVLSASVRNQDEVDEIANETEVARLARRIGEAVRRALSAALKPLVTLE